MCKIFLLILTMHELEVLVVKMFSSSLVWVVDKAYSSCMLMIDYQQLNKVFPPITSAVFKMGETLLKKFNRPRKTCTPS